MTRPTNGPIHTWFGLSYANYLVLHRTLMQSMPTDWQQRMTACLEELHAAFEYVPQPDAYIVQAATEKEAYDLDAAERAAARVTADSDEDDTTYTHTSLIGETTTLGPDDVVLVPAADPVPHYNRGRTYIEPRTCDRCKGAGVDPEHTAPENYGDIVRELPTPCDACQITTA